MIKTSKDVLSKKDIQHISTNVELESDGVLTISIMSSTPRIWQRFTAQVRKSVDSPPDMLTKRSSSHGTCFPIKSSTFPL